MKKVFLGAFILFDVAVLGASSFVLFKYVSGKNPGGIPSLSVKSGAPSTSPKSTSPVAAAKPQTGGLLAPSAAADSSARNIGFSYRNPRVRQVSIRADFTGWKAEPMQKGANGTWTYSAKLSPGEYAYCYTADDKTFKDPANKRTKQIGRTLVSAIVVEARPSSPPK